jgi:hypothetical protein
MMSVDIPISTTDHTGWYGRDRKLAMMTSAPIATWIQPQLVRSNSKT